ncbi:hypothetical protein HDV00_000910 [Rhizophlyctis rosea]|nr:hypothetical protein HDV00_000910 [Rhizophlyctis rosea]
MSKTQKDRRKQARRDRTNKSNSCGGCSGRENLDRSERNDMVNAVEYLGPGYTGINHRYCAEFVARRANKLQSAPSASMQNYLTGLPSEMDFEDPETRGDGGNDADAESSDLVARFSDTEDTAEDFRILDFLAHVSDSENP